MWRMLQQLFSRRPRRSVVTRLRLHVEALENRLVPSASNLGSLLLPPAPPSGHPNLGSAFKTETRIQDHVSKKAEIDLGSASKIETKGQHHVGKKADLGSMFKSPTKQDHVGKKANADLGSSKTETKSQHQVGKKAAVDVSFALKSGTKQDHVGKKAEIASSSASRSL
jgi:hypothetical protein